jgi:hypothetical protein
MNTYIERIEEEGRLSTHTERIKAVAIIRAINERGAYLLIDAPAEGSLDLIIRRRHLAPWMLREQVIRHRAEICKVLRLQQGR